jgi:hypothetical protein
VYNPVAAVAACAVCLKSVEDVRLGAACIEARQQSSYRDMLDMNLCVKVKAVA